MNMLYHKAKFPVPESLNNTEFRNKLYNIVLRVNTGDLKFLVYVKGGKVKILTGRREVRLKDSDG